MSELRITMSAHFYRANITTIHQELSTHLKVSRPVIQNTRSVEMPLFFQIIGEAFIWAILAAAAITYFKELAKRAAGATWNFMASLRKNKETEPLVDVVDTLLKITSTVDGKVEIRFGLNIPDEHFGTVISTTNEHAPEHLLHRLASFVISADKLSEVVKAEVAAGRSSLGRIEVEVCANGDLIAKLRSKNDGSHYEIRILRSRP